MFNYKRYPTREDYITVARSILAKYKFFTSPTYVSIYVDYNLLTGGHRYILGE